MKLRKRVINIGLILSLVIFSFLLLISSVSAIPTVTINYPANITITGSGELNLTWLKNNINNCSLICEPTPKIWDIAIPLYINSATLNTTFSGLDASWIRLNQSYGTISFLSSSSTSSLFISNVTISSWNGTDYDWNETDGRASLTLATGNIQIDNATFRNLGNATWINPSASYGLIFNGGGSRSNITNSRFLHNYMSIHIASSGMANATIDNNYFYNSSYDDIYVSTTVGADYVVIKNNYHNLPGRYSIEWLQQATTCDSWTVLNNTHNGTNTYGAYLFMGNNHTIDGNRILGNPSSDNIFHVGMKLQYMNHSIIKNNYLSYNQYNIWVFGENYNLTIINNTLVNGDEGSSIRHSDLIYFINNTIRNMTFSYDGFDVGLRVKNTTNIFIEGNNWTESATTAMFIQKSINVSIKNNYIEQIPMSQRNLYLATDYGDPQCAISVTELYESYLTGGEEIGNNDNVTYIGTFKSDNVNISGNTILNGECLLRSEGTTNLNHDLTNYIYKKFSASVYSDGTPIQDPRELWIRNTFHNLSSFYSGKVNNTLIYSYDLGAVTSKPKLVGEVFADYLYFRNANSSTTFKSNLYELNNALIYFSNGSVVCSDISTCDGDINLTLTPKNWTYILDDYTLTEGVNRQNNPIWISSIEEDSTKKRYNIASNISTNLTNVVIIINVNCDVAGEILLTPKEGEPYNPDYSCSDNVLVISNGQLRYSNSSNTLDVLYNGSILDTCTSGYFALGKLFNGLGILFTTLIILGGLAFLLFKYSEGMDIISMVLTIIFSMVILAILLLLLINDSTGGC